MRKLIFIISFLVLLVFVSGCVQLTSTGEEPTYPDDFIFKNNEIPEGFQLRAMDEEMDELGLSGNPGYIDKDFYKKYCENASLLRIEKVYLSVYAKIGKPSDAVGIYVVKHVSEEDLNKEITKITEKTYLSQSQGYLFLRNKDILVLIITSVSDYSNELELIAQPFKTRLNLKKI